MRAHLAALLASAVRGDTVWLAVDVDGVEARISFEPCANLTSVATDFVDRRIRSPAAARAEYVRALRPSLARVADAAGVGCSRQDDADAWLHEETRVVHAFGVFFPITGKDVITFTHRADLEARARWASQQLKGVSGLGCGVDDNASREPERRTASRGLSKTIGRKRRVTRRKRIGGTGVARTLADAGASSTRS